MKQKMNLEPGKKYPGYGRVNEYGEFDFTPKQTGSRPDAVKTIKEMDGVKVCTTKNLVLVTIKVDKSLDENQKVRDFMSKVNDTLTILNEYEL